MALINDEDDAHTLTGGAEADTIFGNGGDDTLLGLEENDSLDGGTGDDSMEGGLGDDTYVVDAAGDIVVENADEGLDVVQSAINYTLGANVENLLLTGSGDLTGTGNALNNVITGHSGRNTLDGSIGTDTLIGGAGDDIYVTDGSDTITELANEGTDSVLSSAYSFALAANVENLTLTGTGAYQGTGNDLANVITGNNGNNTLAGAGGDDTIDPGGSVTSPSNDRDSVDGGSGDDLLNVDYSGLGTGVDLDGAGSSGFVRNSAGQPILDFREIERVHVVGTGFGDTLEGILGLNTLEGGMGHDSLAGDEWADSLSGGDGNDTLLGGEGNDTLLGGDGDDTFAGLASIGSGRSDGNDSIDGGAGIDFITHLDLSSATAAIVFDGVTAPTVTLPSGLAITGVEQFLNIKTGSGNDSLVAVGAVGNSISAGSGDDTIKPGGRAAVHPARDTVDGGSGDDWLIVDYSSESGHAGYGGGVSLYGTNWSANIRSASRELVEFTNIEHVQLIGSAFDDSLDGRFSSVIYETGLGDDVIQWAQAGDHIDAGAGTDFIGQLDLSSATESITLAGGASISLADGTMITGVEQFRDVTLGSGNDSVLPLSDFGSINAGAGDDTINLGVLGTNGSNVRTIGGAGNDLLMADFSARQQQMMHLALPYYEQVERFHIVGTDFDDWFQGDQDDDTLEGGAGDDRIDDYEGNNLLMGGNGNDTISARWGNNTILGGDGDDFINPDAMVAAGGVDSIDGGAGNDVLFSADLSAITTPIVFDGGPIPTLSLPNGSVISGIEEISNFALGSGNDSVTVNPTDPPNPYASLPTRSLDGGSGDDLLNVDFSALGGRADLMGSGDYRSAFGGAPGRHFFEASNFERFNVIGTDYSDHFRGGDGNDTLAGGDDSDLSEGWTGDDLLIGGEGADGLVGEAGNDTMLGGGGNDYFGSIDGIDSIDGGAGTDSIAAADLSLVTTAILIDGATSVSFSLSNGVVIQGIEVFNDVTLGSGNDSVSVTWDGGSSVDGGLGDDTLTYKVRNGAAGSDVLNGNNGSDVANLDYSAASTAVRIIPTDLAVGNGLLDLTSPPGYGESSYGDSSFLNIERLNALGTAFNDTLRGLNASDTLHGGEGHDSLLGNSGADSLTGGDGNDSLDGGADNDTLRGGIGDDTYLMTDALTDVIVEATGEGTDAVRTGVSGYTLGTNLENLTLTGVAAVGTGNSLNNALTGNASANTLDGATGSDTLAGLTGDDTYVVDALTDVITEAADAGIDLAQAKVSGYTLAANLENLTLVSNALSGEGNALGNVITGNNYNNTLNGGGSSDTLAGLAGSDTYVIDVLTDVVSEAAGAGTDAVQTSVAGYTLVDNVENLTLLGSVTHGTGNALNNVLTGNAAANTLDGGVGRDTLIGASGSDTYLVDMPTDVITEAENEGTDKVQASVAGYILAANVENLTLLGTVTTGTGNLLSNLLTGNAAANTLNGGGGSDTLVGLAGDDTYVVDALTDVTTETANAGTDLVQSSVSGYMLASNIEHLTLIGTATSGTGNTLNNLLTGNALANTLQGGGGLDSLNGGAGGDSLAGETGNDTYTVDALTDVVTEVADEGTDLVQAAVAGYTLAADVENLILLGTIASGSGNTLNNLITGNAAANSLAGGAGRDTMVGLTGDDTFVIDTITDVVTEAANEGTDLVQCSVSGYTLAANVEKLTLTGTAFSGTGNTLANLLTGNTFANTLTGGAGSDTMAGLTGDDTYVIDVLTDVVTETAGAGTDLVQSSVSGYTLATNVENLTLTGSATTGTGNTLNNLLTGNAYANSLTGAAGHDSLDGGKGRDSLGGGLGNDSYTIDQLTDVVTEAANEGTDLVQSSVSGHTLTSNVENLTLLGTVAKGTGNSLNNVLTGNAGANIFDGGAGNDNITAAGGHDFLLGGIGNDTLTGADLTTRGVGEVDTLTGAANNDRFLLGDSAGRFYDDGNAASTGTGDYALITDFTPGADRLQLEGTAAQYFLGASPVAGVTGTALFFDSTGAPGGTDELIAIIQSPSTLTAANVITPALFV